MSSAGLTESKREWSVGRSADLSEGERLIVRIDDRIEVGVFRNRGELVAFENMCPHAGGPVCQGLLIPEVIEVLDENRCSRGFDFDDESMLITCPWHGFEFRLASGEHTGDPSITLNAIEVMERDGEIVVVV